MLGLAAASQAPAQAVLRACAVEREPAQCGTISVPDAHEDPGGRRLALDLVVEDLELARTALGL